jgi:tetratricopeptide (TPR) repeat protein
MKGPLTENAMRLCSRLLLSCLSVLALVLAARAPARAQGVIDMGSMSDEQAKAHFKVGKSLYESGRFAEAAVEWEQAYSLSHKAPILYNLYVAYRDASDLPKAIGALRRYLATDEADAAARVNLQARLHAMEESNTRASQPAPQSPADKLAVSPPATEPAIAREPASRDVPAPPPRDAEPELRSHVLSYVLLAAGGALIVSGVATGIVTSGKISDIKDACPNATCPASYNLDSNRSDARVWRALTVSLAGAGVVTASIGAILLFTGGSRGEAESSGHPTVAFACAPSGCAGSVRARF